MKATPSTCLPFLLHLMCLVQFFLGIAHYLVWLSTDYSNQLNETQHAEILVSVLVTGTIDCLLGGFGYWALYSNEPKSVRLLLIAAYVDALLVTLGVVYRPYWLLFVTWSWLLVLFCFLLVYKIGRLKTLFISIKRRYVDTIAKTQFDP